VALVESDRAELLARLQSVEVGASPLQGHSRQLSAQYARVRIRQAGIDDSRLMFGGTELVTVTRAAQKLTGAAIEKAACEAVEAANSGATAEVTYRLSDLRLPEGRIELKAQKPRVPGGSSGTVPVQVLVEGRQEALVTVSFRLVRRAPTVVATRDLLPGSVLTGEDVRLEERPVVAGPIVLSDLSQAVGQQVAIPIKGERAVTASMLRPAVVLKRGARVKLICRGPSFTVTATGEALQDASAGQPVRVRNLTSLRELTGRTVDGQTVEVQF
jgi:flagella basal body P-ring formation protein FlgA